MLRHTLIPVLAFLAFTIFSIEVVVADGILGFVPFVSNENWGMQMMLDIVLAVAGFLVLAGPEAKRLDIPFAPYVVASLALGSVGVLAFFVHRGIVLGRQARDGVQGNLKAA
jgi:hypothetical protein